MSYWALVLGIPVADSDIPDDTARSCWVCHSQTDLGIALHVDQSALGFVGVGLLMGMDRQLDHCSRPLCDNKAIVRDCKLRGACVVL